MKNKVKRAMDAHLNCLHASAASRAAILSKAQGGIKVKKKLSMGLILALTLMLIVIGALAAVILTHKEFVDQVLSPKASESTSESWTQEEMDQILRIAKENGVTLDEEVLAHLKSRGINYKEEVMRLFAKEELGFYPSTWSIEDQAWYNQMLVKSGLAQRQTNFVPEGDEISQLKALDIVLSYIRDNFDVSAVVTDTSVYRRHMTYQSYSDNLYSKGKQWVIEYQPLDQVHSYYSFKLLSDGTVKEAKRDLGLREEGRPALMTYEVLDLYRNTYGDHTDWTMETWISFHNEVAAAAKINSGAVSENLRALLKQRYGLPDSASISKEAAVEAAVKAVSSSGGPDEKSLHEEYLATAVYLLDDAEPTWKVSFFNQTVIDSRGIHMAEVDARTAAVRHTDIGKIPDSWIEPYVLHGNLPIILPTQAASTPRPDGKPKIWYSDIAPNYYWEALDKVGYTADTAAKLMGRWHSEYGTNNMFWPLEAQAIDIIWHEIGQDAATVLPGLPAQGDIPQEKALEIAWQAFRQAKAQMYDTAFIDSLKPAVSFTFNTPSMGDHIWFIRFVEVTPTASNVVGGVTINAVTGEIMGTSSDGSIFLTAGRDPSTPAYTPRPDGKPGVWYSDLAPAYYWEALDATGYNRDNAAEFQRQWAKDYGEDKTFWPLTAKALDTLWHFYDGSQPVLPGLPGKEDMTQEEAIALAREAILKSLAHKHDQSYLNSLTPSISFEFNSPNMGDHVWFIQFFEITPSQNKPIGFVTINAKTGEVLNVPDGISNG